jgi:hypothetical protein
LIIALLLTAPLVSWIVLVAPPPPLIPIVNFILGVLTMIVSIVFLILLSPLILLLSLLRGGGATMPPIAPIQPPQIPDSSAGERPLWPALIFWGCVLILIGIAIYRYLLARSDLRDALRQWRLTRWLLFVASLFRGWASDARAWVELAGSSLRRMVRRRRRRARRAQPRGARAQLRALFRRMQAAGTRRGIRPGTAQTPYEYRDELSREVPIGTEDIQGLTEAYVAAEYGPRPPGSHEVTEARRHWRRLRRWLTGSGETKRLRRRT